MGTKTFTISLPEELSGQLDELSSSRSVSTETLIRESVENMLTWEKETLEAYEEGIREVDRGEFYTNEEVRAMLDSMLPKRTAA